MSSIATDFTDFAQTFFLFLLNCQWGFKTCPWPAMELLKWRNLLRLLVICGHLAIFT